MPKLVNGLYKNPNGRFWLYNFRWRGVPYKGNTGLEARPQAVAWLKAYREQLANAEVGLAAAAVPTLKALHERWEEEVKDHLAESTLVITELRLRLHFSELLDLPCDQITAERVGQARARYLAGARHSQGGANRLINTLRDLLGWGVRRHLLKAMPFKIERLKPQRKVHAVVWPEQVPAFLAAVQQGEKHPHASLAVQLQLALGLRESEALGARWDWVDWRRGVYQVGRTKSRKVREVPVPLPLLHRLQALHKAAGRPTQGLILPAEDGLARRPQYSKKPIARAGRQLGIPGLTPHSMRRTFATTHFEANTPISQIQQMMGHEHPETTMRYIVQRPKAQAEAQAEVSQRMGLEGAIPTQSPTKIPKPRKSSRSAA